MKKKRYRYLAAAVALATGAAVLPGYAYAAEATAAQQEPAAAAEKDSASTAGAAEAAGSSKAAQEAGVAAAEGQAAMPAPADERTTNWNQNRPDEKYIESLLGQFESQTIVDTRFEGASEKTEPTAKAAISMHAGDMFTPRLVMEGRDSIYNTGYFYDIYPTFEKVPEGVIVTYHVLENPVLTGIELTGNTVEKDEDLYKRMGVKEGEILNSRILHENIQAIQDFYHKDGYILMKVTDMNISPSG